MEIQMQVNTTVPAGTVTTADLIVKAAEIQGMITVLAGPPRPRTLPAIVEHVRTAAPCGYCGSAPGGRCNGRLRDSVHMGRIVRAFVLGEITVDELAVVVKPLGDRFTGSTIVRNAR
jgi:hypothetical protein